MNNNNNIFVKYGIKPRNSAYPLYPQTAAQAKQRILNLD